MSKKEVLIVGIIVIILLVIGAFMVSRWNVRRTTTTQKTIPQGWSIYVDPQNRYQVSYPADWDFVTISDTLNLGAKPMINQVKSELAKGGIEVTVPSGITITNHASPTDITTNSYQKTITKQTVVDGIPATEYIITYLQNIGFANAGDVDTIVVIKKQNNIWIISPKDTYSKQIFNQLLATFRFTSP